MLRNVLKGIGQTAKEAVSHAKHSLVEFAANAAVKNKIIEFAQRLKCSPAEIEAKLIIVDNDGKSKLELYAKGQFIRNITLKELLFESVDEQKADEVVKEKIKIIATSVGCLPSILTAKIKGEDENGNFKIDLLKSGVFLRTLELSELL